jgi:hypothetical protein
MSNRRELSRAEQVRRRRAEQAAKELQETKTRALKPSVKVTSRTPTIPISAMQKQAIQKQKERRRFNVALGLPEIHLHKPNFSMPSMPKFRADWRMASIILTVLLGVAIYLVLTLPYFYVPAATVLGSNRLSREEINGVLGVTGQSIFTVQPEEVRERLLLNYPELLSAEVKVYLPNHVYVTVVERQPVVFWQQDGEGYTWIDANGVAFRPRGIVEGLAFVNALDTPPALTPSANADPLSPPPYLSTDLVEAIRILAPLVPAGTTLTYSTADGLSWADPRGWQVVFGTGAKNMPLKIRVYQSLVESLNARRITPVFISVVYPDGPYYRLAEVEETTEELSASDGQ